jgi:hypothetical protein
MRGLRVVGGALAGAIVIGVIVAMRPWLSAGHVPTVDETISETEFSIESAGGGEAVCAYCRPLDELRSAFVRRVEDAQHRVAVLKDSISNREAAGQLGNAVASTPDIPLSALQEDLAAGERNLSAARAAVERINGWRKHCQDDAICRPSQSAEVVSLSLQSRCKVMTDPVVAAIAETRALSEQVLALGTDCEGRTCPGSDCAKGHELRQALAKIASALDVLAGPGVAPSASEELGEVRRSAELRDIAEKTSEEIRYTSRLFPMMFNDSAETSAADVLAMATGRLASRGDVLEQVTKAPSAKSPSETELTWRLRLLRLDVAALHSWSSSSVADLRRDTAIVEHWGQLSDDLGSALLHVAKLDLALQRRSDPSKAADCNAARQAADAGAAVKAALAAMAVCARRSGCPGEEPLVSAPIDAPTAVEMLRSGLNEARLAVAKVSIYESEAPQLGLFAQSFAPGEAIQLSLETSRSQCLARSSGLLRLTNLADNNSTIAAMSRLGEGAYLAAPQVSGNYKLTLVSPAARGAVAQAETAFAVSSGPRACTGFDGRWQTDFGTLHLSVRDHNVTGTYQRDSSDAPGVVVGVVSGTVLRGKWSSRDGTGGLRLTLDDSAKGFSGTFSRSENEIAGSGTWTGKCAPEINVGAAPVSILPY